MTDYTWTVDNGVLDVMNRRKGTGRDLGKMMMIDFL